MWYTNTCTLSTTAAKRGKIFKGVSICPHQLPQLDPCRNLRYRNFVGKQYAVTVRDACSCYCTVIHFKREFGGTEELINPLRTTESYFSNGGGYRVAAVPESSVC